MPRLAAHVSPSALLNNLVREVNESITQATAAANEAAAAAEAGASVAPLTEHALRQHNELLSSQGAGLTPASVASVPAGRGGAVAAAVVAPSVAAPSVLGAAGGGGGPAAGGTRAGGSAAAPAPPLRAIGPDTPYESSDALKPTTVVEARAAHARGVGARRRGRAAGRPRRASRGLVSVFGATRRHEAHEPSPRERESDREATRVLATHVRSPKRIIRGWAVDFFLERCATL